MRRLISIGCFLLVACVGCGDPAPADAGIDSGPDRDGGSMDAGPVCAQPSDCDDNVFCNGAEVCRPGESPNGCLSGTPPCSGDQTCNEEMDRCDSSACPSDPDQRDMDGDGHLTMACAGGDDCDDGDGDRYPTNDEVCDAAGHDEDCMDTTLAGASDGDLDGDGFISAGCCNGESCGDDCNDGARAVAPGALEICNAVDDDCDGTVDEPGAFCPVGTCVERRCRALGWEKVFGTARLGGSVMTGGVTVDDAGNSYVALSGSADLDEDGDVEPADTYLVSIAADGRHNWHSPVAGHLLFGRGLVAGTGPEDLAVLGFSSITWISRADGTIRRTVDLLPPSGWDWIGTRDGGWFNDSLFVLATVGRDDPSDPMEPPTAHGMILLRFDSAGTEVDRRIIEGSTSTSHVISDQLAVSAAGVVVTASTDATLDIGAGTDMVGEFVVSMGHDFRTAWAVADSPKSWDVAISETGEVALAGDVVETYVPPWGGAPWSPTDIDDTHTPDRDAFVVMFSSEGDYVWHRIHDGPDFDRFQFVAFDRRGGLMVGGSFSGAFSRTPGIGGSIMGDDAADGFYGVFGVPDGFVLDARSVPGSGQQTVGGADVDTFGNLVLLGTFIADVTLPSGTIYVAAPPASNAWAVRVADFR